MITKDYVHYSFEGGDYILIGDFFVGEGFIKPDDEYEEYDHHFQEKKIYKISLMDIEAIASISSELEAGKTILLVFGILVIGFVIFAVTFEMSDINIGMEGGLGY